MLTDRACARAKPTAKPRKLFDGRGLFLLIAPSGTKGWRLNYRWAGKRKTMSFGAYPEVSLVEARQRRDEARAHLRDGRDPLIVRKRDALTLGTGETFSVVAERWFGKHGTRLAPATFRKQRWILDDLLLPYLGPLPLADITPSVALGVLHKLEARGLTDTLFRAKHLIGQVFRYAIAHNAAAHNPVDALRDALTPTPHRPRPAITDPATIGRLMRAIDAFDDSPIVAAVMQLNALCFVRPGELRQAEWAEFDLEAALWRIPEARMKSRRPHLVPLARQTLVQLRALQTITGAGRYLFPSIRSWKRPLSDSAVNHALRRMGFSKDQMTAHGFRALASTRLHEMGFAPEVIEVQLAHIVPSPLGETYNRARYLEQRIALMAAWADELDRLRRT